MKCYNHEDREAVAQCNGCGRFLCRECADEFSPPLCAQCAAQALSSEIESTKNAAARIKKEESGIITATIVCAAIGFLIGVGMAFEAFMKAIESTSPTFFDIIGSLLIGVLTALIFAVIFGTFPIALGFTKQLLAKMLNTAARGFFIIPVIGWVFFLYAAAFVFMAGIVIAPFKLIKHIKDFKLAKDTIKDLDDISNGNG